MDNTENINGCKGATVAQWVKCWPTDLAAAPMGANSFLSEQPHFFFKGLCSRQAIKKSQNSL